MIYGLWLSAAGLQVNEYRQAVIANNLANVDTAGFKRDLAVFRERLTESRSGTGRMGLSDPVLDDLSGGTWLNPTATDFSQGPLEGGGPLDVAMEGDGFFTVQADKEVRYTRDGRFTLTAGGDLVTVAGGYKVLDRSGQPIHLGQIETGEVLVDGGGRIQVDGREAATLGVTDFADRRLLVKAGRDTFDGRYAKPVKATGVVRQGHYEGSSVEPTTEMVNMIEAARLYQLNATLISLQDGMAGRAVNDVGRVA
jgi:flagellar basal-body rod protein FlgF